MKTSFLALILISCLLVSCAQDKSINENSKSRIKLKEVKYIEGYQYTIIEVDSVEYLSRSNGGIIRISK